MSDRQPELKLVVSVNVDSNVAWLEKLLDDGKCWMTARDIESTTLGRVGDRDVRALASQSGWIISGQKGYKHLKHATPEEQSHAANWLESQAKKMSDRAGMIRRNSHKVLG